MANGSDSNGGKLDLGLSALLASTASPAVSPTTPPDSPLASDDEVSATAASEPARELSVYERLANEGRWRDLIVEAEQGLASGQQIEPRLWWIRAQLEGESMPASFLAAPFEAVCGRIGTGSINTGPISTELRRVLEPTGRLLLTRLRDSGDNEHRSSLEPLLAQWGISVASTPQPAGPIASAGAPATKDAFRDVEFDRLVSSPSWSARSEVFPRYGAERVQPGRRLPVVMLTAAVLLCLAFGLFFVFGSKTLPSLLAGPEVLLAAERFIEQPHAPELVIPAALRRDPVGTLGALYYYIDDPVPTPPVQAPGNPASSPADATGAGALVGTAGQDVAAAQGQKAKERINTKGPVEGPEFTERRQRFENGPAVLKDPQRSGSGPVLDSPPARKGPAGGIHFVIARTTVLSEPSYDGKVMAELRPGDRVFVEKRLGRWVRIRSVQGRGGFVLAEDIEAGPPRR